jgi:hypothetical protein
MSLAQVESWSRVMPLSRKAINAISHPFWRTLMTDIGRGTRGPFDADERPGIRVFRGGLHHSNGLPDNRTPRPKTGPFHERAYSLEALSQPGDETLFSFVLVCGQKERQQIRLCISSVNISPKSVMAAYRVTTPSPICSCACICTSFAPLVSKLVQCFEERLGRRQQNDEPDAA